MSADVGMDLQADLLTNDLPPMPLANLVAPHVNLLPPEIGEKRALKRLAAMLAGVVVLCGGAVAGGYVYAGSGEDAARADLDRARSTQSVLQAQQRSLAPAQAAQEQLLAAQQALGAAMGTEVLWSRYLDELRLRRPDGTRFTDVSYQPIQAEAVASGTAATPGQPAPSGTGQAPTGAIATLTLTGKARTQPDVAALLDQLAGVRGFTGVYLTSTDEDSATGLLSFTVTASVTPEALSNRYTPRSTS